LARLEYRLLDAAKGFPVLYYYDPIDKAEIAARFACDYFVKNAVVYEKTSCAVEPTAYVIYVNIAAEETAIAGAGSTGSRYSGIRLEFRQFKEGTADYPVVNTFEFMEYKDVLLYLLSDYQFWLGQEWQKTSTEIDEDRKVYVYYAKPTV